MAIQISIYYYTERPEREGGTCMKSTYKNLFFVGVPTVFSPHFMHLSPTPMGRLARELVRHREFRFGRTNNNNKKDTNNAIMTQWRVTGTGEENEIETSNTSRSRCPFTHSMCAASIKAPDTARHRPDKWMQVGGRQNAFDAPV